MRTQITTTTYGIAIGNVIGNRIRVGLLGYVPWLGSGAAAAAAAGLVLGATICE